MKKIALYLLTLVITITTPAGVFAYDQQFFSSNNILFYDPNAQDCAQASGTGASYADSIPKDVNERAKVILTYLTTQKGMTLAQASGFVGNMLAESGLQPNVEQGGALKDDTYVMKPGVGFGLVQWTTGSRQEGLQKLADSTKRPITNIYTQLDYIYKEITTTYKSTTQALTSTPNLDARKAAIIVHGRTPNVKNNPLFAIAPKLGYEASGDNASQIIANRVDKAEQFYNQFKDTIKDGSGFGSVSTSFQSSSTDGCASTGVTAGCTATAPIYGVGGNGIQLKQPELEELYGVGGSAIESKLVSVDFLGKSVKVHQKVAGCLKAVADEIKKNNITYKIKTIGGFRVEKGAGKAKLEDGYHYYGVAIDINSAQNGYYDKPGDYTHDMPDSVVQAFNHHGWSWGGDWHSIKDYMHFEFNGFKPGGSE